MYTEIENLDKTDLHGKKVILFGASTYGIRAIEEIEQLGANILFFCDNDEKKHNCTFANFIIKNPKAIYEHPEAFVIITSTYRNEIKKQLKEMGVKNVYILKMGVRHFTISPTEFINKVISPKEANSYLYEQILSDSPFFIGRIGSMELECICSYLYFQNRKRTKQQSYPNNVIWGVYNCAGVFPKKDELYDEFCELYLKDLHEMDLIWSMWFSKFENQLYAEQVSEKIITDYRKTCLPIDLYNPWTKALEGKKVLVIHPFEDSIKNNYKHRAKFFKNKEVLPNFDLITLKAVQSIAGTRTCYTTWFEALESMKKQIDEFEFDIALIGAGAYGLPLGAYIKRIGKKALHIGGVLQLYFGIRGKFYDQFHIYNEYWTKPFDSERPKEYLKVESGRYW